MAKKRRIPLPPHELVVKLKEQLGFIDSSAKEFDSGNTNEYIRLATSVRILVHETNSSKSLLGQLGLNIIKFYDTSSPYKKIAKLPYYGLCYVQWGSKTDFFPFLDMPISITKVTLFNWWNGLVIDDRHGHKYSRKDIILAVVNTDGGAHVDPNLDEDYANLKNNNILNVFYGNKADEELPMGNPIPPIVRQISYELQKSIRETFPNL